MAETTEIVKVEQAEMLQAVNRAEIDIQIATAKAYPRNVKAALERVKALAAYDEETAQECFYELRRKGQGGRDVIIEGLSVRMAEIIAGAWGNLRVQTRIVGNDGKIITAQAVCLDLETNVAVSKEVQRRITDRNGRTFSEDMQVVTGNAACAIAYRNAVLTIVPKAITKDVVEKIKETALGKSLDLDQTRQNMINYFAKLGVTQEMLLQYVGVDSIDKIDNRMIFHLRSTANAIKEGTTSVHECFVKPAEENKQAEAAEKKVTKAEKRASEAIAKAMQGDLPPEAQDTVKTQENGEFDGYDGSIIEPEQLEIY